MNHLDPRPRQRDSLADANPPDEEETIGTGGERVRSGIQGQVMRKESSFAADQPTIHLLFGSGAIKEINAYVPRKATMAIVGILIIGLSRRPFNRP